MAKESGLRHAVLERLSALHAVPIESPLEAGVPDVNCTAGWIELKHLEIWPVREDTIVQPPHFKPAQRAFLRKRCAAGGRAWLLLRVGSEWVLCWGTAAAEHLGVTWTRSDLVALHRPASQPGLVLVWQKPPSSAELIRALVTRSWL